MRLKVKYTNEHAAAALSARCPQCGHNGVFVPIGNDVGISNQVKCGQRICPNPNCKGHLFVVIDNGQLVAAYPPLRIDFNSENVPASVRRSFEEALDCHAQKCHVAAAMMVRRTLEEICADRGATGDTLKQRLKNLESKIVLPQELIAGMDELRLLGNDAAHIDAQAFGQVSDAELSVAIEFTKEILKGLYQYASLLARIRALKSPGP